MQRSPGVTASAVVVIIGGVFTLFAGVATLLGSLFLSKATLPDRLPPHLGTFVAAEAVFIFGFGGWGLASGIGLLHRKQWARISLLIFAGILVFISLPAALLMAFIPLPTGDDPNLPANFAPILRVSLSLFYALFAVLGIFWLYFFNKRSIKLQFIAGAPLRASAVPSLLAPLGPAVSFPQRDPFQQARPLSITLIAWFLLIGSALAPLGLITNHFLFPSMQMPLCFLGFFLFGPTATVILIAWMALQAAAAFAMLKLKPSGLFTTIALQCFGVLNLLLILTPANRARFQQFMQSMLDSMNAHTPYPVSFTFPLWLGVAVSLPAFATILFFLITRRHAFLAASRQFPSARPERTRYSIGV
jgi:hypothetical protein